VATAQRIAPLCVYNEEHMFFRREKTRVLSFDEHIQLLKQAGFTTQPAEGGTKVINGNCGAILTDVGGAHPQIGKAGIVIGNEIGLLVDGGFQKFFLTPAGRREPAQATHLHALHDFEENLRESLGLISLYNQSLGTTCDLHLYDRVKDRDHGVPKRAWE
jgi:hypothetical protein